MLVVVVAVVGVVVIGKHVFSFLDFVSIKLAKRQDICRSDAEKKFSNSSNDI